MEKREWKGGCREGNMENFWMEKIFGKEYILRRVLCLRVFVSSIAEIFKW